ncbi:glucosaminidase domain-containing protein [Cysteiniphilum sp. QT6929]|uniref:glucosaminidase domain-containing protein n=1 Tax=Cysteiniphilum sp. QT6929 TaxID=2975055 RepID=UPI0024B3B510|nr:glucosaminidase domain-containing protein [Cysteiniphilum sp. QT6929]WHN66256.1 glucosaminidase domain-containing protein [Cysteiniphilum sp. QT6929]
MKKFMGCFVFAMMCSSAPVMVEANEQGVISKPNFKAMTDVKEKKQAFVDYMLPYIETVYLNTLKQRQNLQTIADGFSQQEGLSKPQITFLVELAREYDVDMDVDDLKSAIDELLIKVNVVPVGLTLAQAALESGWGTSRFASQGNNYFGQHCFTTGCGMIPTQRGKGQNFEVQVFNSPEGSIQSYYDMLNTGQNFTEFRDMRDKLSQNNQELTGKVLLEGLDRYSELPEGEYQKRVLSTMNYNNFCRYNNVIEDI